MRTLLYTLSAVLCAAIVFDACKKEEPSGPPHQLLSEFGFFAGPMADLNPSPGVVPYDLNTPLFSDYAGKARFVVIPPDSSARYTAQGVLEFPVGTILIKNFFFLHDMRDPALGRRILETRLLIHEPEGWMAYTYLWNEAQTEATYSVVGRGYNVSWIHDDGSTRQNYYTVPNQNQCKSCHNIDERFMPIGPKANNLNKSYPYAEGAMNQLEKWSQLGILSGAPAPGNIPAMPVWNDPASGSLDARARAYLEVNCAHCHNARGPANNSGLLLNWEQTDSTALGICKLPIAAGQGSGGFQYDIVPGRPDSSIMIYRMNSNQATIAMPEVARSLIHEEGVQLIRDWIASLSGGCQ